MGAKQDQTKQRISDTFMVLSEEMPLDKISVRDIVETCSLTRQSFYYHFMDKWDLIQWIFETQIESDPDFPDWENKELGTNIFFIKFMIFFLYLNKTFYIKVFKSSLFGNIKGLIQVYIRRYRECQINNILAGRTINPQVKTMIAEYFTLSIVELISNWAAEGMRIPPDRFYEAYAGIANKSMEFLLEQYSS